MPTLLDECCPARLDYAPAMDDASAGSWSMLYTKGQREKRLARELYAAGVDFFLPLSERVRRTAYRQRIVSITPLFAHYLFVRGGDDVIVRALATQHVYRVIRVANQPKLRRDLANLERAIQLNPALESAGNLPIVGQQVEVKDGPFEGLRGVVIKRGKDTLLVIEVESCGKATMEIDAARVEPAN